jgi:hypothetical protein
MVEKSMSVQEVRTLLADIERGRDRHDRQSGWNDRWFSMDLSTNVIQRSAVWSGDGWHATHAPGALRAHVRIRIPVWMAWPIYALSRRLYRGR